MNASKRICVLILFSAITWYCPAFVCAQKQFITFAEKTWGENPENRAYDAVKDPFGFIWFATGKGLARWDGLGAKLYQHDPADSNSIATNELFSDGMFWNPAEQNLWIPTSRALDIFDPVTEKFTHYRPIPGDTTALPSANINVLLQDRQGTIWLGTAQGHLVRCAGDKRHRSFQARQTDRTGQIHFEKIDALKQDFYNDSILWIGTGTGGLIRLNHHTFEARRYYKQVEGMFRDIRTIIAHPNGLLFVKSWSGKLLVFDPKRETVVKNFQDQFFPKPVFRNQSIRLPALLPGEERIWLRDPEHGLFLMDPDNFQLRFIRKPVGNAGRTLECLHLMTEENSTLWLGTSEGVLKERINPNQVENYFYQLPEPFHGALPHGYEWPDCGGVYRASSRQFILPAMDERGLHLFNLGNRHLEYIPPPAFSGETLSDVRSIALLNDEQGLLIVNFKLFRIHFNARRLEYIPLGVKAALIYRDARGRIWLVSQDNKLYRFDEKTGRLEKIDLGAGENVQAIPKRVFADKNDNLWIDYEQDMLAVYQPDKNQYLLLSGKDGGNFRPCGFGQGPDGIIYVCNYYREGANIGFIDPDQPEKGIQDIDWLQKICISNQRKDMALDERGRLWVLSKSGLEVIDLHQRTLTLLGAAQGIITWDDIVYRNPAGEGWLTPLSDGVMAIVYRGGLGLFHTDSLLKARDADHVVPRPYLTAIYTGGHPLPLDTTPVFKKNLVLDFSQNDLSFEYSMLYHGDTYPLTFMHRLDGVDDDWVPSNRRFASYPNLPPGHYTFRVNVVQGKEVVGLPYVFSFIVRPPWYRTWWAYCLYIAAALALLLALRRFELRRHLAQAEARRLQELDQAKTRLYTNITHEFRTPLTVILGMVEQIQQARGAWIDEGLRLIRRNGTQLLQLVNQLLELAKLESGHLPLRLVQGDVAAYLHYLTESFHSYAESKDIRLHFLSAVGALPMDHDPEKLQRIISNLLSNAIKFTPAGGDVYLQLSEEKSEKPGHTDWCSIRIKDTGIGIAPEHLPHVFDRFFQVDDSTTRPEEGSGIGLALVRELVHAQGGAIEVKSAPGAGTEFHIRLPITRTAAPGAEAAGAEQPNGLPATRQLSEPLDASLQPPAVPGDRHTVLLVEDNPDVITYLSAVLASQYRIETAKNGQEGIDKALELTPDVIVSDVMMPVKDGFELCRALKTDERSSHIPIVLLTARTDQPSTLEGLRQGADAYLAKPFHPEELLVRLEKLIELRRRLQERYRAAGGLRRAVGAEQQSPEDRFVQKVVRIVEESMHDELFGMPQLCQALHMSRTNLFRKLKALTGKSATDFIRTLRLEKSRELLETTDMNVTEVCYAVGFNSPNYFSRVFQELFGVAPGSVRKG